MRFVSTEPDSNNSWFSENCSVVQVWQRYQTYKACVQNSYVPNREIPRESPGNLWGNFLRNFPRKCPRFPSGEFLKWEKLVKHACAANKKIFNALSSLCCYYGLRIIINNFNKIFAVNKIIIFVSFEFFFILHTNETFFVFYFFWLMTSMLQISICMPVPFKMKKNIFKISINTYINF